MVRRFSPMCGCCQAEPCPVFTETFNSALNNAVWGAGASAYTSDGSSVLLTATFITSPTITMQSFPSTRSKNWEAILDVEAKTDAVRLNISWTGQSGDFVTGVTGSGNFEVVFGTGSYIRAGSGGVAVDTKYYDGPLSLDTVYTIKFVQCNEAMYVYLGSTLVGAIGCLFAKTPKVTIVAATTGFTSKSLRLHNFAINNFNDGTVTGCPTCSITDCLPGATESTQLDMTDYISNCATASPAHKICVDLGQVFVTDSVACPNTEARKSNNTLYTSIVGAVSADFVACKCFDVDINVTVYKDCDTSPVVDGTIDLLQIKFGRFKNARGCTSIYIYIAFFKSTDHTIPVHSLITTSPLVGLPQSYSYWSSQIQLDTAAGGSDFEGTACGAPMSFTLGSDIELDKV